MNNDTALVIPHESQVTTWSANDVMRQVGQIQDLMKAGMRDTEHYGVIPGCGDKPALLKPGAEKLCLMFRLAPRFEIQTVDMPNGHREYRVTCSLYHINSGAFWGSGVGSCSTMESKYRYRSGVGENTRVKVPKDYWDLRRTGKTKEAMELIGGKGYTTKKDDDGIWYIYEKIDKTENPDIADTYNTVLKMGKKRALVDATLSATAASDIFTQDVEENAPAVTPLSVVAPVVEQPTQVVTKAPVLETKTEGEEVVESFSLPSKKTSKTGQSYYVVLDHAGNRFFVFDSKVAEFLDRHAEKPVRVKIKVTEKGRQIVGFSEE